MLRMPPAVGCVVEGVVDLLQALRGGGQAVRSVEGNEIRLSEGIIPTTMAHPPGASAAKGGFGERGLPDGLHSDVDATTGHGHHCLREVSGGRVEDVGRTQGEVRSPKSALRKSYRMMPTFHDTSSS